MEEADSAVRSVLRRLANSGYPFARARVSVNGGEYVAVVLKGRFYVLNSPRVKGKASSHFLKWFFRGMYGKAFSLEEVERRRRLAGFYGVKVSVMRGDSEVVCGFEGEGGSVGAQISGGETGVWGVLLLSGEHLLSSGISVSLAASYDSTSAFTRLKVDLPPLLPSGLMGEAEYFRGDSVFYRFISVPYVWSYPFRAGLGVLFSEGFFPTLVLERVSDPYISAFLTAGSGELGGRLWFKRGWFYLLAFRGLGRWRERVGGMDRFREIPYTSLFSQEFALVRVDVPVVRIGRLRTGPFADALFERRRPPLYAYGIFLKVGDGFSAFISARRLVGVDVKVSL